MKILLADDHPIMRDAYKMLLRQKYHNVTFGDAGDTGQTITAALEQTWDVIILDLAMPGGGGLEALKTIRAQRPMVPVLVVSTYDQQRYVLVSFQAGAAGYLNKGRAGLELVKAIEHILAGGRYIEARDVEYMTYLARLGQEFNSRFSSGSSLSKREKEVMRALISDKDTDEVIKDLHMSASTFHSHRKRILDKLCLSTNAELMYCAFKNLIEV